VRSSRCNPPYPPPPHPNPPPRPLTHPTRHPPQVSAAVSRALLYLHSEHKLLHGDVKSANVLLSRGFQEIKLCDLGVSLPLGDTLHVKTPEMHIYEGTEPWRPPESLCSDERGGSPSCPQPPLDAGLCDRSDIFPFGLVLWEMLTAEIPHGALMHGGDRGDAYRRALGTRPPLPPLPSEYTAQAQLFHACTHRQPGARPSAAEICAWHAHGGLAVPAERCC
jgi:PDZ-binding kinase